MKILDDWMLGDDHSIDVNKIVCDIIDTNVCIVLVANFETPSQDYNYLQIIHSSPIKKNIDRFTWLIMFAGPLSRACKLATNALVVEGVARDTN